MKAARRFQHHFEIDPQRVTPLPPSHTAIKGARTLFPSAVVKAHEAPRLLVSGANQRKIGDRVCKGSWKGFPIFCLTLEERATCPTYCLNWGTCYGNGMPRSRRHQHGHELEYRLWKELNAKSEQYPCGFVVRLHILGDFYDAAYTHLWARWLAEFPALRIFGYTAHRRSSTVGAIIAGMNEQFSSRCALRFSGGPSAGGSMKASTIWTLPKGPVTRAGIVCPAQTGQTDCCGTCGLCWSTTKNIVFIGHGQHFKQEVVA